MQLNSPSQYLSPEPLLQSPAYVPGRMAQTGMSVPSYAFALNNPLKYADADGLKPGDVFRADGTESRGSELSGQDLAAIDAANYIREQFPYDSYIHEYSATIYSVGPRAYSYLSPVTNHSSEFVRPNVCGGQVARIHTHAIGRNRNFSDAAGDLSWAAADGTDAYLLLPDEAIRSAKLPDGWQPQSQMPVSSGAFSQGWIRGPSGRK